MKSIEKAAIILRHIGADNLENILKHLKKDDVRRLRIALKNIEHLPPEQIRGVLREIVRKAGSGEIMITGDVVTADKLGRYLKQAEDLQVETDDELEQDEMELIDLLERTDYKQLIELLKGEHPQVIAFLLSYIPPGISGQILQLLPLELQADIAFRIATMGTPQKDMIKYLNKMLGAKLRMLSSKTVEIGGIQSLVNIIRGAGRQSEKAIMEHFLKQQPELADEMKGLMRTFEDIVMLEDRSVQRVLKEVDTATLSRALKKTTQQIKDLIMRNLSERARTVLQEEVDGMGLIPIREVDKAQQRIVEVVREMEEKGEISVTKEEEEYV